MSRRRSTGPRRGGSATLAAAVVAVVVAFGLGWWLASRSRPVAHPTGERPPVLRRTVVSPSPLAQRTPPERPVRTSPAPPRPTATPAFRVAIVFDDAGGSLSDVEEIIAIGRPVAVAVLPGLVHSADVARRARAAGLEVLLHLPVEPEDETKELGPGGVTVSMTDAEIRATVRSGLASVPGAIAVNNHMGSKGTADPRVVRAILEVVRKEGLFFLDSVTTPRTVVGRVAAELGVRTAARTVFLDNENEEEAIRGQVRRLIALAKNRGSAVAIGHAQRLTRGVVAAMLHEFDQEGVTLVPLSTLVR